MFIYTKFLLCFFSAYLQFLKMGSSVTLQGVLVAQNTANRGASVFCVNGSITIENSVFNSTENTNEKNGVYCDSGSPSLTCAIVADSSSGDWVNVCQPYTATPGKKNSGKIAPWGIALIVIFVVAAVVAVAGVVFYIVRRKKPSSSFAKM